MAGSNIFGVALHLAVPTCTVTWLCVMLVVLCLEAALERLEVVSMAGPFHAMLQQVYKEMMLLGVVGFIVFVISNAGMELSEDTRAAFDFAHMSLLFVGVFYAVQASWIMLFSGGMKTLWVTVGEQPISDVLDDITLSNTEETGDETPAPAPTPSVRTGRRSAPSGRTVPVDSVWETRIMAPLRTVCHSAERWHENAMECKILERLFKVAYALPPEFPFGAYLSRCLDDFILDVLHIDLRNWFVIVVLLLGNWARQLLHTSGGYHSPHLNGSASDGHDDHAADDHADDHADDDADDDGAAHHGPLHADGISILDFLLAGLALMVFCGVLLYVSYMYEWRLVQQTGVTDKSDFESFLALLEAEDIVETQGLSRNPEVDAARRKTALEAATTARNTANDSGCPSAESPNARSALFCSHAPPTLTGPLDVMRLTAAPTVSMADLRTFAQSHARVQHSHLGSSMAGGHSPGGHHREEGATPHTPSPSPHRGTPGRPGRVRKQGSVVNRITDAAKTLRANLVNHHRLDAIHRNAKNAKINVLFGRHGAARHPDGSGASNDSPASGDPASNASHPMPAVRLRIAQRRMTRHSSGLATAMKTVRATIQSGTTKQMRTEADISLIFIFHSPELYFFAVQLLLLLNCFYSAIWLTTFSTTTPAPTAILLVLPAVLSLLCMPTIVRVSSLLHCMSQLQANVVAQIIEAEEGRRTSIHVLRERLLQLVDESPSGGSDPSTGPGTTATPTGALFTWTSKAEGSEDGAAEAGHAGIAESTSLAPLEIHHGNPRMHRAKELLTELCRELDRNDSDQISLLQFRELVVELDLHISSSRCAEIFAAIDHAHRGYIPISQIARATFPHTMSLAEVQERQCRLQKRKEKLLAYTDRYKTRAQQQMTSSAHIGQMATRQISQRAWSVRRLLSSFSTKVDPVPESELAEISECTEDPADGTDATAEPENGP